MAGGNDGVGSAKAEATGERKLRERKPKKTVPPSQVVKVKASKRIRRPSKTVALPAKIESEEEEEEVEVPLVVWSGPYRNHTWGVGTPSESGSVAVAGWSPIDIPIEHSWELASLWRILSLCVREKQLRPSIPLTFGKTYPVRMCSAYKRVL